MISDEVEMTLVQMVNIKKSFPEKDVLQGIHAKIHPDSRIGLVGTNGAGKTTLFKIILGTLQEDEGEIIKRKDLRTSYLPQIPEYDENLSVLELALEGYTELQQMEKELSKLEQKLSNAAEGEIPKLVQQHDRLLNKFQQGGGYRYRADTEAVLHGLGFSSATFSQKAGTLSGGQKNRLGLARTLLRESHLLLLDEPTNFLDIECTEWLESYLKTVPMAMLIVSHDRYFLNQLVNEIWELSFGKLTCYKGNYDKFQEQKEAMQSQQMELYERQQEEIKRQEDFVRRNIYGQKHKLAQSRRRMLGKLERLEAPLEEKKIHLSIDISRPETERFLEVRDVGHGFGERNLFQGLSFSLQRSEKLAVVGPNGCGKSTLLHILIQKLQPLQGKVSVGSKVKLGFYHQELEGLDEENTVFDTIKKLEPTMDDLPVRNFLALFLFRGDDIYKIVKDLSGGEKSRLAMAKLLLKKPNFLVLDEPTNHLDINSREALEDALKDYEGTIVFVSHDRYFIDQVATRMLYFYKQRWINFHGNYSEFMTSKENLLSHYQDEDEKKKRVAHENVEAKKRPKKRIPLEKLEENIIAAETRLEEITQIMATEAVYQNPTQVKELKNEYDSLQEQLQEWNKEWESWVEGTESSR